MTTPSAPPSGDRRAEAGATPRLADLAPDKALRRLELTVLRRLDGLLHGDYLGLVPGAGSEPDTGRLYVPGQDDVRRMDWNVTARTAVPHVRDVVADRELQTWALVDASASMDFGTASVEKRDLAVAAVAAIGFLTERAGNGLGAHVLGPDGIDRMRVVGSRNGLLALLDRLLTRPRVADPARGDAPAPSRVGLAEAIDDLAVSRRRRGMRVVVSDFVSPVLGAPGAGDDRPDWEDALRRLTLRQQVLVVEVVDPLELHLPDVGMLAVIDPETGRRREVWTGRRATRERYAAAALDHRAAVAAAVKRSGADHLVLRTDRDWVRDIARFAHERRGARPARGRAAVAGVGAKEFS